MKKLLTVMAISASLFVGSLAAAQKQDAKANTVDKGKEVKPTPGSKDAPHEQTHVQQNKKK